MYMHIIRLPRWYKASRIFNVTKIKIKRIHVKIIGIRVKS